MRPVVLIICDGWGVAPPSPGNAISQARTPVFDRWLRDFPSTTLLASGEDVGLPAGLMGNSEVGHLNLGAGRVVYQAQTQITRAIHQGTFFEEPVLRAACAHARARQGALHLLGLISDGGVHSDMKHV